MEERLRQLQAKFRDGTLTEADFTAALESAPRQILLVLTCKDTSPRSAIFAWHLVDPRTDHEIASPEDRPPYASVIEAMNDGWEILQLPNADGKRYHEFGTDYIGFTFYLQKHV